MHSSLNNTSKPAHDVFIVEHGMQFLDILPGIHMEILDMCSKEDVVIEYRTLGDRLEITFVLNGEANAVSVREDQPMSIHVTPNTHVFYHMPNSKKGGAYAKDKGKNVGINMDTCQLKRMLGIDEEVSLDKIMCSNERANLTIAQKIYYTKCLIQLSVVLKAHFICKVKA